MLGLPFQRTPLVFPVLVNAKQEESSQACRLSLLGILRQRSKEFRRIVNHLGALEKAGSLIREAHDCRLRPVTALGKTEELADRTTSLSPPSPESGQGG